MFKSVQWLCRLLALCFSWEQTIDCLHNKTMEYCNEKLELNSLTLHTWMDPQFNGGKSFKRGLHFKNRFKCALLTIISSGAKQGSGMLWY